MAPDLRRKVDQARATRLAREAEMKKQVSAQVSRTRSRLSRARLVAWFSVFYSGVVFWATGVYVCMYVLGQASEQACKRLPGGGGGVKALGLRGSGVRCSGARAACFWFSSSSLTLL